jgi:hypothetical protein
MDKVEHRWMKPRQRILNACIQVATEAEVHPEHWQGEALMMWQEIKRRYLRVTFTGDLTPYEIDRALWPTRDRFVRDFVNGMKRY